MNTYCGADCTKCAMKDTCRGCEATCGRPFGGACVAAEYIRFGGRAAYDAFKCALLTEVNGILRGMDLPEIPALYELAGMWVNIAYPLPNGTPTKLLDDTRVYLGGQAPLADTGRSVGVVADKDLVVVATYGESVSDPELLLLRRR